MFQIPGLVEIWLGYRIGEETTLAKAPRRKEKFYHFPTLASFAPWRDKSVELVLSGKYYVRI
jgi:hypothetical protein